MTMAPVFTCDIGGQIANTLTGWISLSAPNGSRIDVCPICQPGLQALIRVDLSPPPGPFAQDTANVVPAIKT